MGSLGFGFGFGFGLEEGMRVCGYD